MNQPQDSIPNSVIDYAPKSWRSYLQLSRFDRPIGFWLLALPCFMGQFLGRIGERFSNEDFILAGLWIIGAIAMRGAGCTINDIVDKDFDAKVERTKNRPLACGAISVKQAVIWLGVQLIIGFLVLLALPRFAQIVALCAVPLVVAYPFMKRITWWPQAWLGMTFNWGVFVGFAAVTGEIDMTAIFLWLGTLFWTLGYDTIYAMSDVDDDALIGVKSTARRFGKNAPKWVAGFYIASIILIGLSIFSMLLITVFWLDIQCHERPIQIALAALPALFGAAIHLFGQVIAMNKPNANFSTIFRSNKTTGIWFVAALVCVVLVISHHKYIPFYDFTKCPQLVFN